MINKKLLGFALALTLFAPLAACEQEIDEPLDPNAPAIDPAEPDLTDPVEEPVIEPED